MKEEKIEKIEKIAEVLMLFLLGGLSISAMGLAVLTAVLLIKHL